MPITFIRLGLAALVAGLSLGLGPAEQGTRLHRQSRRMMGTLAEIQVYHADSQTASQAAASALDEMERVDRLLSNFIVDSELSRMNAGAARAPFRASSELYAFVKRCRRLFDETLGTFDPTMGPIARAWGFFTPRPSRPDPAAAATARAHAGFDKITLDDSSRSVSYAIEGLELDPGGIGKGYAADRAADVLRRLGISSALISAGGSTVCALGRPPGKTAWKVAIRDPVHPARSLRYALLRDAAISTSGLSHRFVEVDGRRYGHIIDPRTREPAEGMCQVSVIANDATRSDALTKAAFLLSRRALLERHAGGDDVHVLRVEGGCGTASELWITPWSSGVFFTE